MCLTIDETLKIVQIGFYFTAGTVVVLTYLSAKKGLLNTVNTEYHKRAFEKLEALSQELISEFDPDSANYWAGKNIVEDCLKEIYETFEKHKTEILKLGEFATGVPVRSDFRRLDNLVQKIKSDPFIPSSIRDYVAKLLEERASKLMSIHIDEIRKYTEELAKGKMGTAYEHNSVVVHNRINDRLYEEVCGVSQVEEQVHSIRLFIQKYLEGFNPLKENKYHKQNQK